MFVQTPNSNIKTPKTSSSSRRRNDSGELDVFEAAQYFSGENPAMEETLNRVHRSARMSLDIPIFRNPIHPGIDHLAVDHKSKGFINNTKFKQPSSPGARLASFLNSLLTASKKKKKSKSAVKDAGDDDSAAGRRKRRSSISHFRITGSNPNNNSSAITPTKSYKEMGNSLAGLNKMEKLKTDQKSRLSNGGSIRNGNLGFSDKNSTTTTGTTTEMEFRKFSDVDDGADTDSSSDLFDLPNHELDFYSNSLPVYGTTNMDRIRIVAPISTTAATA